MNNRPEIQLDNYGQLSSYRRYKQNKSLQKEQPLNIKGGKLISLKNKLNGSLGKNYRYNNEIETTANMLLNTEREMIKNKSHLMVSDS